MESPSVAETCSAENKDHGQSKRRHLFVLIACAFLSIWSVRAVGHAPQTAIPTTGSGSATVPLFNVWTILWNAEAAGDGFTGYWDAPIFCPMTGGFASSEPQPLTVILAPLRWLGASPGSLYNFWLVGSLTLNGYAAWRVLCALSCRLLSACSGAAGMVLLPMVHDQLDVLQLVSIWPSSWVILVLIHLRGLALSEVVSARKWGLAACQLAVAGFCTAATCLHHCLFLAIVLSVSGWLLLIRRSFGRWFITMSLAFILASALILPWLLPMRAILKGSQFAREEKLVAQLSAVMPDLINVSKGNLFPALSRREERAWYISPGNLRTLLALVCLPMMIWLRRRGTSVSLMPVIFFVAFVVISGVLSLGTNLDVGGTKPWTQMCRIIPGLAQIRSAFRFGYFYQMGILLLASFTLHAVDFHLSSSGWRRILCRVLCCAGAMVVAAEVLPSPLRLSAVPKENEQTPWIKALKSARTGSGGVLMVPFAPGSNVDDFELTTRWMISLVSTDLRLVNGYSGFFPQLHYDWQKFLASQPTPLQLAERMRANEIEFVVIMDDEFQKTMNESTVSELMFDEISVKADRDIRVFRLR